MNLSFCEKLHRLIEQSDGEMKARLQAVYEDVCGGGVRTNDEDDPSGGNGPPPKPPREHP